MVWEIRTVGASDNGGGFDPTSGTPGTDFSIFDNAEVTYTDLAIDGSTDTDCTSSEFSFTSVHVGNVINVTSGTGFTVQRVQILSVSGGVATCDKSLGTLSSTGGNGKLGGALDTIQAALTLMTISGMKCYVKATATYSISTGLTLGTGASTERSHLIGYTTTRGDGGKATIQASAALDMITTPSGARGWHVNNFILDGNSGTGTKGIVNVGTPRECYYSNIKIQDFSAEGVDFGASAGNQVFEDVEVTGCSGTTGAFDVSGGSGMWLLRCWSHDNDKTGIDSEGRTNFIVDCWSTNNTGASSDGFTVGSPPYGIQGCVAYKNGRDGIRKTGNQGIFGPIKNCILANNTGYGINLVTAESPTLIHNEIDHNAFFSNTAGARNNLIVSDNDVTLTVDPFTDADNDDYTLNNTVGGGRSCRAAGTPPNRDIGAFQHADPVIRARVSAQGMGIGGA